MPDDPIQPSKAFLSALLAQCRGLGIDVYTVTDRDGGGGSRPRLSVAGLGPSLFVKFGKSVGLKAYAIEGVIGLNEVAAARYPELIARSVADKMLDKLTVAMESGRFNE